MSPVERIVARVLAEHEPWRNQVRIVNGCRCGERMVGINRHRAHVADEIAAALRADEGLVKAMALAIDRADDKWQHGIGSGGYDPDGPPLWLARAALDAITGGQHG